MFIESTTDSAEQVSAATTEAPAAAETTETVEAPSAGADGEQTETPEAAAADTEGAANPEESESEPEPEPEAPKPEVSKVEPVKPARGPAPIVPEAKPEPKLDDFEDYEQFNSALMDWKLDERDRLKAQAAADAYTAEVTKERGEAFSAKLETAKTKYSDFEAKVSAAPEDIVFNELVHDAIVDSDITGDLVYHLASNPAEAKAIADLSRSNPIAAVRAIVKLEAQLAGSSSAPAAAPVPPAAKPPVTKAPEPIRSTANIKATATATQKNPDQMTHAEYCAWRESGGGR